LLRLPAPTRDSKLLLNLLRLSLAAHPPQAPIVKAAVTARAARPRSAQGGLFVPPAPDAQRLEVTLARIAGVVGEGRAGAAELLDTHRPGAFRMARFAASDAAERGVAASGAANHSGSAQLRTAPSAVAEKAGEEPSATVALRIFRPAPRALVDVANGVPARVSFGGIRGEVVAASGPWRVSGDWWEPDGWRYEMWDVEIALSGGAAGFYRIYFDSAQAEWLVAGEYD
jgi:protein ImuB